MDFIVGLPMTSHGHNSIWVIVDHLTKMFFTKTTIKTLELARLCIEHVYKLYGLLTSIISDRDQKLRIIFGGELFPKDWTLS